MCSILALTIVVFGVAYHVNHRNNYTIETADFDFQKHNMEELLEKTFFERMRDTFLNSVRTLFMCDFAHFRWRRMTEDNTDATRNSADDDENVSDDVGSPVRELQLSSPLESVPSYSASSNSSPFSQYNGIVNSGLDVTEETTTIRSKNKRSKKNLKRRIDRDSGVHSDIDQKAS